MFYRSELITWNATFSCGIKLIDEQHKQLVALVNDMFNHITGNDEQEREYFNKVIKEAINYIKVHFATEEKIMRFAKYEGYAEHKREHDAFILTVITNILAYKSRDRVSLLSFTKFLKNWILSHIAVMDKQYFDYFRKIATRKNDGRLSISSSDIRYKRTA